MNSHAYQQQPNKGSAPKININNNTTLEATKSKSNWPLGDSYSPKSQTFLQFAKDNFVEGTPVKFVRKELKKPLLVYTPEKEKEDVIKVWIVLIRYMGDLVDYRTNLQHETHQPELGSVMTRLCRQLGQDVSQNPFGPAPAKPGDLNLTDDSLQVLPTIPKLGTLRKLKNTISLRLFGKGRKSVFQFLPLEETLMTNLDKIQYIIGYAILRPRLRDELYCGLCRQFIQNPYKESIEKGWVLMNLMCASFAPSARCLGSILQFLDVGPKIYSAAAKQLLLRTAQYGGRLHPPSTLEYMAVLKKNPLELEVNLMDGKVLTLVSDGSTRAHELCQAAANKLGMRECFGFHLFISNRNKVSSLGGNDHLLDSVSQLEQISRDYQLSQEDSHWRLYFRKEVFEPWDDYKDDPVVTNLIYAQIRRGVFLQELHIQSEDELTEILAKICYIEKGSELNQDYIQDEIVSKYYDPTAPITTTGSNSTATPTTTTPQHDTTPPNIDANADQNDSNHRPEREYQNIEECIQYNNNINLSTKIFDAFKTLYNTGRDNDAVVIPNSYKVKLELISYAREQWGDTFSHCYDITVVIDTGEVMVGVMRVSVHSLGVVLLGEEDTDVIQRVGFVEIMQLGEEINPDELTPHSVVLRLLDGRDLVIVTQDAADVRDMMSHMLLGLTERSNYAVAITQNTSQTTDDLDLAVGDLLLLDRSKVSVSSIERNPDPNQPDHIVSAVQAKNVRTGQVGNVSELMFHILPTVEAPEERILTSYKERDNWSTN